MKVPRADITLLGTFLGFILGQALDQAVMWGLFGLFAGAILELALRRPYG